MVFSKNNKKLNFFILFSIMMFLIIFPSIVLSEENILFDTKQPLLNLTITAMISNQNYDELNIVKDIFSKEEEIIILYYNLNDNNLNILQNDLILSSSDIFSFENIFENNKNISNIKINLLSLSEDIFDFLATQRNIDLNYYSINTYYTEFVNQPLKTNVLNVLNFKLLFILIFLTLVLILFFFSISKWFKLKKETSFEFKKIENYFKENLEKGYSLEDLKNTLLNSGHNEEIVLQVIKKLTK